MSELRRSGNRLLSYVVTIFLLCFITTASASDWWAGAIDTIETRWPNGHLKEKWIQKTDSIGDGGTLKEGTYTSWHENGQMSSTVYYWHGKEEGWWHAWHENGQLKEEGQYMEGKKLGLWLAWFEDGERAEEAFYGGVDRLHGRYVKWSQEEGYKIVKSLHYRHSKLHGMCAWQEDEGEVARSEFYLDGKLMITFSEGGQEFFRCTRPQRYYNSEYDLWVAWEVGCTRFHIGKFVDGAKKGRWTIWSGAGELIDVEEY